MRVPERFVDASWSVSATSYGSSQLTREEEDVLTGGQVADFLSAHLKGPRFVSYCRIFFRLSFEYDVRQRIAYGVEYGARFQCDPHHAH